MEFLPFRTIVHYCVVHQKAVKFGKNLMCGSHLAVNSLKLFRFVFLAFRCVLIVCNNLQAHSPEYVDTEVPGIFCFPAWLLYCGYFIDGSILCATYVHTLHLERSQLEGMTLNYKISFECCCCYASQHICLKEGALENPDRLGNISTSLQVCITFFLLFQELRQPTNLQNQTLFKCPNTYIFIQWLEMHIEKYFQKNL